MTTYTISLDLIHNIESDDIISILFRLINKECEHAIAIDNNLKLLKAYTKEAKDPDSISLWISFLSDKMRYTPIPYDLDEDNIHDLDIMKMTASIVGSRKMIVHTIQSVTYITVNQNNEAIFEDRNVPVVTRAVAIKEINHQNTQNNNFQNCQIANGNSTISKSKIS